MTICVTTDVRSVWLECIIFTNDQFEINSKKPETHIPHVWSANAHRDRAIAYIVHDSRAMEFHVSGKRDSMTHNYGLNDVTIHVQRTR